MAVRRELPERFVNAAFTTRDLLETGIGVAVLRRNGLVRVTRGVHTVEGSDERTELTGLLLILPPETALSCHTAARLWSLPSGPANEGPVHVRAATQIRRTGVIAHRTLRHEGIKHHGLRVVPPVPTFLDLASHLGDAWLLAYADALVKRGYASATDVAVAAETADSRQGIIRARRVAALVRAGVDSPMESLLRHLLLTSGLAEPTINVNVHDSHGGWIARPDLSYPDRRMAIEYDGRHHFQDRRQWENDIARRHNLENEGWVVRIATARDVFVQPDRFGADMLALWRRRG